MIDLTYALEEATIEELESMYNNIEDQKDKCESATEAEIYALVSHGIYEELCRRGEQQRYSYLDLKRLLKYADLESIIELYKAMYSISAGRTKVFKEDFLEEGEPTGDIGDILVEFMGFLKNELKDRGISNGQIQWFGYADSTISEKAV